MDWIIFIIAIAVIGGILQAISNSEKVNENGGKNAHALKSLQGFNATKKIVGVNNEYIFAIDESNKKIAYIQPTKKQIVSFDKIISVEIIEDNTMLQQKSSLRTIGGAIIGGVAAGGAGAIVGGLSGESQLNKKVSKVQVKIKLRDIDYPSFTIDCFNCKTMTVDEMPVKPSSMQWNLYKEGLDHAYRIADTVSVIIDMTDKEERGKGETPNQPQKIVGSVADELIKLAKLKADGILTEEEFAKQKELLLGNVEASAINKHGDSQGVIHVEDMVPQEVRDALDKGQRLEAIKLYKEYSGCSLSETLDFIDSISKNT